MRHSSRLYVVSALLGFVLVGTERLHLTNVPITILAVGLCAALRRPRWVALGCLLAAVAYGSAGGESSAAAPDPSRPAEVVVRVRSHWRQSGDGFILTAMTEHYRQRGAGSTSTVIWNEAITLTIDAGAVEEVPPHGSRLRVLGYVRRAPPPANFGVAPRNRRHRVTIRHPALMRTIEDRSLLGSFWSLSGRVRRLVLRGLVEGGGDGAPHGRRTGLAAPLFRALVLGDPTGLPPAWSPALRRTGTVHVLAVSGLHVGLLLVLVLRLTAASSPIPRALAGWMALCTYLLLVGPRPSLTRAAVMGGAGLLSLLVERPRSTRVALEWALLLLVAREPSIVQELGFQLTASATLSILWASRWFERCTPGSAASARSIGVRCLSRIGIALAAQLGTLPFLLPRVGLTAVWGPVVNLVAIPWAAISLSVSWLWLPLGLETTAVGRLWATLVDACGWLPRVLASLPTSVFPARLGRPGDLLPLAGLLGSVALWTIWVLRWASSRAPLGSRRGAVARIAGSLALVLVSWAAVPSARERFTTPVATPELVFLDVGQGDAILVRDGSEAVLIDGGGWLRGDIASSVLAPALTGIGLSRLPSIASTHGDRDHCKGLLELSTLIPIDTVWLPAGWTTAGCLRGLAQRPGLTVRVAWRGQRLTVGRWRLEVLWPLAGSLRSENGSSLVVLAEVHGRRVLLTGDIDAATEREIVEATAQRNSLEADLLKLAHHGSRTSTSELWLEAARPRLAIASVGKGNSYGHPAPPVLERLRRRGVRVLRTDLAGAVRVRFPDGAPMMIESGVATAEFD